MRVARVQGRMHSFARGVGCSGLSKLGSRGILLCRAGRTGRREGCLKVQIQEGTQR